MTNKKGDGDSIDHKTHVDTAGVKPVTSKTPNYYTKKYRDATNNFKNCTHPTRIYGAVCFICGDVI